MAKSLGPAPAGGLLVEFDVSAFDAAAASFGRDFDTEAAKMITDAMQRSAEVIQRAVVKSARPHRRTGRLERQIRIVAPTGTGFGQQMRVKSGGRIAHLVAGPVRGHDIPRQGGHPRKAMPLLYGKAGLAIGFAEHVYHPATRGDPYFSRGVKNARLAVNNVMQAAIRRLAAHLAEILGRAA
jgi:hypothetical protein